MPVRRRAASRPRASSTSRRSLTSRAFAKSAENAVASHLEALGFSILFRNLRLGALELDLVARKGALVAIVEVRARGRGAFAGPFASVTQKKRDTLVRAAERLWREVLRDMEGVERVRIDVAGVTTDGERLKIEYAPSAITA